MRLNILLVFVVLIAITASVKGSLCSIKCDALFFGNEQMLVSTILSVIPGSRSFLNSMGFRSGNAKHSECMQRCGENKSDVCKTHCDVRFTAGRAAFKYAPNFVVKTSEALGFGVSDEHFQTCLTDCYKA